MTTFLRALTLTAALLTLAISQGSAARAVEYYDQATIADLSAAMTAGTLTSEKLVQLCLARIDAYDRKGPALRAVMTLNPKALDTARASTPSARPRGRDRPLHGIPIVLKDNFDTVDLPTTGGSVLLEGSVPPDDAFVVKKLRDAGAIILAKVNLSEFASGGALSSLGGQTLNPHDLAPHAVGLVGRHRRSIAAGYAPLGLGTDTGGSIRGPSTSNGIVGLKPTHGLAEPRRHHPAGAQLRYRRPDGAQRVRHRRGARRHDGRRSRRTRRRGRARDGPKPTTPRS